MSWALLQRVAPDRAAGERPRAMPKGWSAFPAAYNPPPQPFLEAVEVQLTREDLEAEVLRLGQLVQAERAELRALREALEDERARHLTSRIALIQTGAFDD